jgi:hypothetical protein
VVTEFEFALHQVGAAALTAELFYGPPQAPAALRRWRELLVEAPRQATLTAWAGTSGRWPFLPPELWGRPMASVGYVWVGDPDRARGMLASLRDAAPPLAERVQELSYLELQRSSRSPAASTSTTSPTKARWASSAPTAQASWPGWPG